MAALPPAHSLGSPEYAPGVSLTQAHHINGVPERVRDLPLHLMMGYQLHRIGAPEPIRGVLLHPMNDDNSAPENAPGVSLQHVNTPELNYIMDEL